MSVPHSRSGAGRRAAAAPGPDLFGDPGAASGATAASAVSVATLVHLTRDVLEGFPPLWIRGEVADFKAYRSGHWYFTLRDDEAQLRCVVWKGATRRIAAPPDDGMQVFAFGQLTVYVARGDMQFTVSAMDAAGDGLRRKALRELTDRLQREGLFDPARKRPLPYLPRRVAVITSPAGAAVHDVIAVVRRRCPIAQLVVVPSAVQGEGAPAELRAALERVARLPGVETVIIGRGGGAQDDLWAFNDEGVARALAACPYPTISAVGHQVDSTLCDLVADERAPTPSAAAERAVPVLDDERARVAALARALRDALARRSGLARERYDRARRDLRRVLDRRGADARQRLDRARDELRRAGLQVVERRRARLESQAAALHALSPLATLGRGYAVARDPSGAVLASAARFTPGMAFDLTLHDGTVPSSATGAPRLNAPGTAPARDA